MADFTTQISGIPCVCRVTRYRPYVPAKLSGAMEDAEEAIPSEFEYQILDPDGTLWDGVRLALITDDDEQRLQDEYEAKVTAIKHMMDYD